LRFSEKKADLYFFFSVQLGKMSRLASAGNIELIAPIKSKKTCIRKRKKPHVHEKYFMLYIYIQILQTVQGKGTKKVAFFSALSHDASITASASNILAHFAGPKIFVFFSGFDVERSLIVAR
jgi:hypothetical protein